MWPTSFFFYLSHLSPYIKKLGDELAQLRHDSVAVSSMDIVPLVHTNRIETDVTAHVACKRISYPNVPAATVVEASGPPVRQCEDVPRHTVAVSLKCIIFLFLFEFIYV